MSVETGTQTAMLQPAAESILERGLAWLERAAMAALTLFILGTTWLGRYPDMVQFGMVLLLTLISAFVRNPTFGRRDDTGSPGTGWKAVLDRWITVAFIGMAAFATVYVMKYHFEIAAFRTGLPNRWDLIAYALGTVAVLEGVRRTEGPVLLAVCLAGIAYMAAGPLLPGIAGHRGLPLPDILEVAFSQRGILGIAFAAVVNVVYIFVIFGVAIQLTGLGQFLADIAQFLSRAGRAAPARTAILASAFFGMINGSAPANVAATGVLTIPLMKRKGFSPVFAGAVEATASTVGQIMPPVMGVGAFIMSEITGIPYARIMIAAILPAALFIATLLVIVGLEAERLKLKPDDEGVLEELKGRIWQPALALLTCIGVLLYLLFRGHSPSHSALYALVVLIAMAIVMPALRPNVRRLPSLLVEGGRAGVGVAVSTAGIGLVLGAVASTGLGVKLSQTIVALGESHLALALLVTALATVIMGMGLPTAASYLMVVFIAGPSLLRLGVSTLATHLFVFYYAALSAITPPVALASYAAAAISGASSMATSIMAVRLGFLAFILPFAWMYRPELMLGADGPISWLNLLALLVALVPAVYAFSVAQVGYFRTAVSMPERIVLVLAGVALLSNSGAVAVAGAAVCAAILLRRRLRA